MCLESPDTFMEYHEIQLHTREILQKKSDDIIKKALERLLENDDEIYTISLKGLKLKKFQHNIKSQFRWIEDKCIDSTILFKDYDSNYDSSLKKAYCHIYQIIKISIQDIKPKAIRENLEDYFCAFIHRYCSNKEYTTNCEDSF